MNEAKLLALLDARDIDYEIFHHRAVSTVAEADKVVPRLGAPTKNLFLRDDKKRQFFLVVADENTAIDLKRLHLALGSRRLSFASAEMLYDMLGLVAGSVTPFGALNDVERRVEVVFGEELRGKRIDAHPMVNTATLFIKIDDAIDLLEEFGVSVRFAELGKRKVGDC